MDSINPVVVVMTEQDLLTAPVQIHECKRCITTHKDKPYVNKKRYKVTNLPQGSGLPCLSKPRYMLSFGFCYWQVEHLAMGGTQGFSAKGRTLENKIFRDQFL
jgi:hypothetical protein